MDNIEFNIVWKDNDMSEIKSIISNDNIVAKVNFYLQTSNINKMYILNKQCNTINSKYTFYDIDENIVLFILINNIDNHGHISLSVEINNIENNINLMHCRTIVRTEIGCFDQFINSLLLLDDYCIGNSIALNPL